MATKKKKVKVVETLTVAQLKKLWEKQDNIASKLHKRCWDLSTKLGDIIRWGESAEMIKQLTPEKVKSYITLVSQQEAANDAATELYNRLAEAEETSSEASK